WSNLGERSIESLIDLPAMETPEYRAAAEVLTVMLPTAIFIDEALNALALCLLVNLSLEHGNSDGSAFGYVMFARILGPYFGRPDLAFRFGKLAFDLVQRPGVDRFKGRVISVFGITVHPWTQPLGPSIEIARLSFDVARETGDLTFAAYTATCVISLFLASGKPLDETEIEAERAREFIAHSQFGAILDMVTSQRMLIRALRGTLPSLSSFDEPGFDEAEYVRHLEESPNLAMTACWHFVRKLQATFLAGDYTAALAAAAKAEALLWTSAAFLEVAEFHFYRGMASGAFHDTAPAAERDAHKQTLIADADRMAVWAKSGAATFESGAKILRAEVARVEGRELVAMGFYEEAIRSARTNGLVHVEAIANERAARFHAGRNFDTIAHSYLTNARACWARWGAHGKVRQLERLHPALVEPTVTVPAAPAARPATLEDLDLTAVVRTSQVVSGEVGLERVLRSLIVIALEHAGAGRGLLILKRGDELAIEAEGTTTPNGVDVAVRRAPIAPDRLPRSMVQHVVGTQETVLLDDAQKRNRFSKDPYLAHGSSRSVLCLPIVQQTEVAGVLYLENTLLPDVFTPARLEVLKLLASHAAILLENAALGEKDALLKEVHHRVKNNLQLISSLLNLQGARVADPGVAELFADCRNRVRSMALVHEILYRAGSFSQIPMDSHLRSLCAALGRAYDAGQRGVDLKLELDAIQLDANQAVTCGLIVNELVSNALKYAFPDGRTGQVRVGFHRAPDSQLVLSVRDDGIGLRLPIELEKSESLGLQLVHDLTQQLHGAVTVSSDGGASFTITFGDEGRGAGR
ncbi:MAG: protein kinase, partial [Labilithrix sp.]|nr:protein kinase [Labilithrix sp.]